MTDAPSLTVSDAEPVEAEPVGTHTSGAVAWDTAERVAGWVGSRSHLPAPYRPDLLQADFEELTAQAEELVAESTGLRSSSGPARARVTDRAGWVHANISSFQRLVGPHLDRLDPMRLPTNNKVAERLAGPLASAGRVATGTQMGLVLGWLSTRVLGQYDLLLTEEAVEDQDLVYFVGPNVVALEQLHGFDPREFRLFFISNASPQTPTKELLHVGFSRWRVERCFEDQKTELGFDHFEGRSYLGLKRHQAITAVSHLFLSEVQRELRGEKPGVDRLSGPHRGRRPGTLVGAGANGGATDSRRRCRGDRLYATPQRSSASLPQQHHTTKTGYPGRQTRRPSTLRMEHQLAL